MIISLHPEHLIRFGFIKDKNVGLIRTKLPMQPGKYRTMTQSRDHIRYPQAGDWLACHEESRQLHQAVLLGGTSNPVQDYYHNPILKSHIFFQIRRTAKTYLHECSSVQRPDAANERAFENGAADFIRDI